MFGRAILAMAVWMAVGSAAVCAERSDELDLSSWRWLPVFERGRRMPLETFARSTVRDLCGKEKPTLRLVGAVPEMDIQAPELVGAHELFPGGGKHRFDPAELLLSWLVQPQRWEYVPLLHAEHEQLRQILGVPLLNSRGERLKFVSPHQVANSLTFAQEVDVIRAKREAAQKRGVKFEAKGIDKRISQLHNNYGTYRQLTAGPDQLRDSLAPTLDHTHRQWSMFAEALAQLGQRDPASNFADKLEKTGTALDELVDLSRKEWPDFTAVDHAAQELERSADELAAELARKQTALDGAPPDADKAMLDRARQWLGHLSQSATDLARQARAIRETLRDDRHPLRMVPSLNPAGLEPTSRESDHPINPWMSFTAMLYGPPELACMDVPRKERAAAVDKVRKPLADVKKTFAAARNVYLADHADPDRAKDFAAAIGAFEASLRKLGETVEPIRSALPRPEPKKAQDPKLHKQMYDRRLDDSSYPEPGSMDVEVFYNRFSPFLWSWIVSLAAVFAFALSFGVMRRVMFWGGVGLLCVALMLMTYGLVLRYRISGWVPVTNMFESVVFVALTVSFLGLWLALVPIFRSGVLGAWRLTGRRSLLVPQVLLAVAIFYLLAVAHYGPGGSRAIFPLLPTITKGASLPSINNVLTWAAGLCVLLPGALLVPRLTATFLVSLVTVPAAWIKEDAAEMLAEVNRRKVYVAAGAAVGCFASILAFFAPVDVIARDIGTLRPALHSNFWLAVHVLPITASYGAGALAWGLGNIALAYYLFGRYREPLSSGDPSTDGATPPLRPRPPEACAVLARYVYKAILVAVLLLVAGTILGALWADFAWGRFWGWDAKEVWSLISILAYMVILHGRYIGWWGNFGLAVGAVVGLICILWAWYGVNFLLPGGLHSYGAGSGGQFQVYSLMACNVLFLLAAAVRYKVETSQRNEYPEVV